MAWCLHGDAVRYPSVTVEFGFASALSGFGVWDASLWDAADWGPDVVWTDVSDYVIGYETRWAKSRFDSKFSSNVLTMQLDNRDGRFTPANTSGAYVAAGVSQIRARVPVRITAVWNGVTYARYWGYTSAWRNEFPSLGMDASTGRMIHTVTTVTAVDALSALGANTLAAIPSAHAGDLAGARLARIANAAGWSGDARFDAGVNTMQATTLGANVLSLAQLVADSDAGVFFADLDGALVYYDFYSPFTRTRSTTSQATFGPGASEIGYDEPETANDDQNIWTIVRHTRVGGSEQTASNTDARALYGDRTPPGGGRSDLICETDAQALAVAQLAVLTNKDPEYRVVGLRVKPAVSPAAWWPTMLGLGIRDLCTVKVPETGLTITRLVHVSGISESVTIDAGWQIRLGFDSATVYQPYWGNAYWDQGLWGSAQWFI